MIITKQWVIEYLKTRGTKFIIPKEVTKIEEDAFSAIFGYGRELQEETIEVTFEDDSSLQEIGKNAFGMCKISNEVIVPRSTRRIGDMAFYGCENVTFEEGTQIEKRRDGIICFNSSKTI